MDFKSYLENKDVTRKRIGESTRQIQKMVAACKWRLVADISATGALEYLGQLRRDGRSAQTYNHYLKSAKQFTRWLVRDQRTPTDRLVHLSRLNVQTDRRHDRRALSQEEFALLVAAARGGKPVEGICGTDRAMLYILAAWTGFRKGELRSLTLRSLDLDGDPSTATVQAGYSKRRCEDTQILHPEVTLQLKDWLATKVDLGPDDPLFPVSGRFPGGKERKAHEMVRLDLMAARDQWVAIAETELERERRLKSDLLCYCDHVGLYADFHSFRHTYITSLERVGISPKMAQTLARHSDIRLTLGVYTHVTVHDQTAAIGALPGPPGGVRRDAGRDRLGRHEGRSSATRQCRCPLDSLCLQRRHRFQRRRVVAFAAGLIK